MGAKEKRETKDAKSITVKYGKLAIQGICPTCETTLI
ncbi:DUF5679 domain-containing protein [Chloroflexota bacterium]